MIHDIPLFLLLTWHSPPFGEFAFRGGEIIRRGVRRLWLRVAPIVFSYTEDGQSLLIRMGVDYR
ncbi:hypothetical protein F01_350071 [Burkholderia cenocepacia]|nr:hypothetical protein F01_350071 [Burkholderia cenocepacia]